MSDFTINVLVQKEHEVMRRAFAEIEQVSDTRELAERWRELADLLEVHASAEELVLYPELLADVPETEEETAEAVGDHNEIREAVDAVAAHETGSQAWWEALRTAREVNAEHLDEEERDVLPPFVEHVDAEHREALGMRWLELHEEHDRARGLSGEQKDPQTYVEEHNR